MQTWWGVRSKTHFSRLVIQVYTTTFQQALLECIESGKYTFLLPVAKPYRFRVWTSQLGENVPVETLNFLKTFHIIVRLRCIHTTTVESLCCKTAFWYWIQYSCFATELTASIVIPSLNILIHSNCFIISLQNIRTPSPFPPLRLVTNLNQLCSFSMSLEDI